LEGAGYLWRGPAFFVPSSRRPRPEQPGDPITLLIREWWSFSEDLADVFFKPKRAQVTPSFGQVGIIRFTGS